MEKTINDDISIKKGRMKKFPLHMTQEEFAEWKKTMEYKTRAYLFSIGQPFVYRKDGRIVAEYADGRIDFV